MKHTLTLIMLFAVLAGCAVQKATPKPTTEPAGAITVQEAFQRAHAAVQANQLSVAEGWLNRVEGASDDDWKASIELLRAEVALNRDRPDDALAIASDFAGGEHASAAHEIAGKACLRLGRYEDAIQHFSIATRGLDDGSPEVTHLTDLMKLALGLEAYSNGRMIEADGHWRDIRDDRLRPDISASAS